MPAQCRLDMKFRASKFHENEILRFKVLQNTKFRKMFYEILDKNITFEISTKLRVTHFLLKVKWNIS
jgi:hypothetical protein